MHIRVYIPLGLNTGGLASNIKEGAAKVATDVIKIALIEASDRARFHTA